MKTPSLRFTKKAEHSLIKSGTKILPDDLVCETVARRQGTAHVADSQRFSLGCDCGNAIDFGVVVYWGFARVENTSCETVSTLTPRIAARSFERLAKDYGRH